MNENSRLLEMLTGYAAAHQNPFNIAVHLIGIPIIMLGVFIPLSWMTLEINDFRFTPADIAVVGMFFFYLTLDWVFALVFLVFGLLIAFLAHYIASFGMQTSAMIAAAAFFGGYIAQFIGHAVEKSMPVLLKHPVQANLAAPFFMIVEIFHLAGMRPELFDQVSRQIELRRDAEASGD